jgi:WD40 repeat protein
MNWPTSQDYNEAVQDAANNFADAALQRGEVVVNALGLPVPRSGNFADVYQFKDGDGRMWALKCFTRKVAGLRERYAKIDEHLNKAKLPFTVGFKFMQEGIRVKGEWFPLLKMEWVEGYTLNDFVADNLGKPHYLHALVQMWAKLTGRLRDANMAHADLQHGNVLLVPGATPQKLGLKLIDYDGMWVPALAEFHSGEVGHPNYQHPLRLKEKLYNGDVDRFPHLVIAAALRATLVGGKAVWERFDNSDNLLFKETDLRDPAKAPIFRALWDLNDPVLRTLVGHIALSAKQPLRKTPWLDDVLLDEAGPKLTGEQERQVCDMLGVSAKAPTAAGGAPPPPMQQEFNVFSFFDDDDQPPAGKSGGRRPPPVKMVKRPKQKEQKSKLPLIIGGIAAAIVLSVGGFVAAVNIVGKKDRPTEVVQNPDDDKPKPPIGGPIVPKKGGGNVIGHVPGTEHNHADELRTALAGTRWNWGDSILELKADGSTTHANWDNRFGLTTRWEAIDRRTALLIVEKGRQQNRYAVLEFTEDLSSFTGFDFGGTQRMPARPHVGPLPRPIPNLNPSDSKQDLYRQLAGSHWEWDGGRLSLQANGSADLPGTELTARWEAIDRRTALVTIVRGRASDRHAILRFSEDLGELGGYDFENAARLPARKRLDKGVAPPPPSPDAGVIGVAALPGGRDYLFIRGGDPALHATQNRSALKARELGRHESPITALAVSSDGSRAITGDEKGHIRIWSLRDGDAATGTDKLRSRIAAYNKIGLFNKRFSFVAYEDGIVVFDHDNSKEEIVRVDKPGHPVKGAFGSNLKTKERLPERLGAAVTGEVKVFDGALTVQLFEGGTQLFYPTVSKSWFGWHRKRRAIARSPVNAPRELKTKLSGPAKMSGFRKEYEYTLYREGIVVRDVEANKEETVYAGAPVSEKDGEFEGEFDFAGLSRGYGPPVSVPTKIFDGALRVVLCRNGFKINQIGTNRNWNLSGGSIEIGDVGPPKAEPQREDFIWLDDELPEGAKPATPPYPEDLPWEFVGEPDAPVHSGEKSVKLTATGRNQHTAVEATLGLRVGEGDTLFAHVYLDPKNPPEQIMVQWLTTDWHLPFWGADKISTGNARLRSMGALPAAGKWVRLEIKAEDIGIKPGTVVNGVSLTQFGGTVYWDAIGINTSTPQDAGSGDASVRVLKEHTAAVTACAVSPDGKTAVSVGKDRFLCEWNLADGKLIRKFETHAAVAVAYLPGGKTVLTGAEGDRPGVWDLATQKQIKELSEHNGTARAVCVSPKGDLAFTAEDEGLVRVWLLPDFKLSGGISYGREGAGAMAVSPDGQLLACTGKDGAVRLFDARTGDTRSNRSIKFPGQGLAFLNDGQELVVARGASPLIMRIEDKDRPAKSGAFTRLFEGEPSPEGSAGLRLSSDGKLLLVRQKELKIVEAATGNEVKRLSPEGRDAGGTESLALLPGDRLVRATDDGKFQLWDWRKGEKLKETDFREMKQIAVTHVYPTADADRILCLTSSAQVMWWDVAKWSAIEKFNPFANEGCLRAAIFPDGKQIVFYLRSANVRRLAVWDTVKKQQSLALEPVEANFPIDVQVSPNGRWIVGHVRETGQSFAWDAKTGRKSALTSIPDRHSRGGFVGDDEYLVSVMRGRRVVIDLEKDAIVAESAAGAPSMALAADAGERLFASFDADRRLRVWRVSIEGRPTAVVPKDPKTPLPKDVGKEGLLAESEAVSGAALSASFSGDGKKIFVVTQSGMVHVLDAATLKETSKAEASKTKLTHVAAVQKTPGGASAEKLYLLDEERRVIAWDPEKAQRVKSWDLSKQMTPLKTVHHFVATPTDSFLMIFDTSAGTSIAFDVVGGTLRTPPGLARPPFASSTNLVAFTPDAKLGTANASRKLLVWTVATGGAVRQIEANFAARWLGIVADVNTVAAASGNQLAAWNYNTGAKSVEITDPHGLLNEFHLAAPLKGGFIVTAGRDQTLRVWDMVTGKETAQWKMELLPDGVAMSRDGKFAVAWHNSANRVSLWGMPGAKSGGNELVIEAAFYGQNVSWIDVTDKVRNMVKGKANWRSKVNTADLGEPAPGFGGPRTLVVRYSYRGQTRYDAVYEKDEITLPRSEARVSTASEGGGKIDIIAAFYGQNVSWLDVTDKVRGMVKGKDKWSALVKTEDFGEPAPGFSGPRTLLIRYSVGGEVKIKPVYQNEMITLP